MSLHAHSPSQTSQTFKDLKKVFGELFKLFFFTRCIQKKLQIAKFAIFFNYKNEHRRASFYLAAPTFLTLVILIVEAFVSGPIVPINYLQWNGPPFLRTILCITVSMSYAIFIRSLYMRFAALNSLLRCVFFIICFIKSTNDHTILLQFFCVASNRNQFLIKNGLNASIVVHRNDSIDIIKFVGRQHAFLTVIVGQLNICYAFQV